MSTISAHSLLYAKLPPPTNDECEGAANKAVKQQWDRIVYHYRIVVYLLSGYSKKYPIVRNCLLLINKDRKKQDKEFSLVRNRT